MNASRCAICGALIVTLTLGAGLAAADQPHMHVEQPAGGTFFISGAGVAPSTTTTTAVASFGNWRPLL